MNWQWIRGFWLILTVLSFAFSIADAQVKTGIDVLADQDFEVLKGKRVGLVTNPTGVDRHLRSTVDILHDNVDLRMLSGGVSCKLIVVPLQGVQIYITDLVNANLTEIQFLFLQEAHRIDPGFNPFSGKEKR